MAWPRLLLARRPTRIIPGRAADAIPTILGAAAAGPVLWVGAAQGQPILAVSAIATAGALAHQARLIRERTRLASSLEQRISAEREHRDRQVHDARLTAVADLAAGVAHEVNNPLTGVLGYADLLLAETDDDAPGRAELEVIRTEALRARSIIRMLLEFARPRPPATMPVQVAGLVRDSVELVRLQASHAGVRILESYQDLPTQLLDPAAIQAAVTNVLANALAALAGGGTVSVTVSRSGSESLVRIEDDGVGMDGDAVDRAVLPFVSMTGGRGLGLSVALGTAEAHGGTLMVTSERDAGTVVEIRLPIMRTVPAVPVDEVSSAA
jgi:two-component system, NtrC family, sensor kinase